jgi:hypothetical protein
MAHLPAPVLGHRQWAGVLDAAVGFLSSHMRREADRDSHSLLLLALNRRLQVLGDLVKAVSAKATRAQGEEAPSGALVGGRRWRPDRCAPWYSTYDSAALSPAQVR